MTSISKESDSSKCPALMWANILEGVPTIISGRSPTSKCFWASISAVDDDHYVNLEFQNIDVRITEFNILLC